MAKRLTLYIMIGLVLGIVVGAIMHASMTPEAIVEANKFFKMITDIFLRLIKMIVAPLVFATLVAGIVHMGDTKSLGRVGAKTIGWFLGATVVSLTLGMVLVNWLQPGVNAGLDLASATGSSGIETKHVDMYTTLTEMVPKSIVEAMANTTMLQIVIFSVFFGVALTAIGDKAAPIVRGIDSLVEVMLVVTNYVMRVSPVAVFAAMTKAIAANGLGVLVTFGKFIGSFYLGLGILWLLLIFAGFLVIGPRIVSLIRYIRDPILLAFSTASSEAAYPRTLEALDRFGVPPRIASFVLPLGYSFNLDGSMMYMTFASIFIAQLAGIDLTFGQQVTMLLTLMLTSKGMAAVPRASLVVIAGTMAQFGLPEAGLVLILAVDQFLDMGRTGTNVVGNAVATAVVAKWEGALDKPEPPDQEPPRAPSGHMHEPQPDSFHDYAELPPPRTG
ncbi:MAG: dicarboxylate/amino acid:cation symporter [Sphingomonas bacterium]|uniref:dicarboxylate/amino acid:cation symporter n=1 Tax=Sphingomonas bacterium TaxID=1895847 RepID=UPI00260230BB|nr:dicarboxylate/amino acid:cation symporter [Sphingomonas bacterium]MDB5697038.1 dicarboxylate/amino acid:cation symporter [Sphingomonas bacterium]